MSDELIRKIGVLVEGYEAANSDYNLEIAAQCISEVQSLTQDLKECREQLAARDAEVERLLKELHHFEPAKRIKEVRVEHSEFTEVLNIVHVYMHPEGGLIVTVEQALNTAEQGGE